MSNKNINGMMLAATVAVPIMVWSKVAEQAGIVEKTSPKLKGVISAIPKTLDAWQDNPLLIGAPLAAMTGVGILWYAMNKMGKKSFLGRDYKEFVRGSKFVSQKELASITKDKKGRKQVMIGDIPMPIDCESLHTLIVGGTGTGKSVLIEPMIFSALLRGDRAVIIDPNGTVLSKFYNPEKDTVLNPFDKRTKGWVFYNEVKDPNFDFETLSFSVVTPAADLVSEQWNQYGRLLLTETARKNYFLSDFSVESLFNKTTIEHPNDVKKFLSGTAAESLFVGAEGALNSARFVLSKQFPAHLKMPDGNFSIRHWLEHGRGNLFITWREDQKEAMLPLVSAWVDVICNYTLSLPPDDERRMWLFADEIPSLGKLRALEPALTKGRKHGLRIVAAIQSESQLDTIYGKTEAITLRSCFRNHIALGGSATDPETAEIISRGFGDHEVVRDKESSTHGKNSTRTSSDDVVKERVVNPSDITNLPDLDCFIKFAGHYPIAKHTLPIQPYKVHHKGFVSR